MAMKLEQKIEELGDEVEAFSQTIFDYMKLNQPLKKSDIVFLMGSPDTLPAERAADVLLDGWSNYDLLVISGGAGRNSEFIRPEYKGMCEAEVLADVAIKHGVSKSRILIESYSTNSGENISFTRRILNELKIYPQSMINVHMPSAERRDYASIKHHWPEIDITTTSPRVPWSEYHERGYQGNMTRKDLIGDLLGDFQRLFVFPSKKLGFGFMIPQYELTPQNVQDAYHELVKIGYGESHLVKYKDNHPESGKIIPINS